MDSKLKFNLLVSAWLVSQPFAWVFFLKTTTHGILFGCIWTFITFILAFYLQNKWNKTELEVAMNG